MFDEGDQFDGYENDLAGIGDVIGKAAPVIGAAAQSYAPKYAGAVNAGLTVASALTAPSAPAAGGAAPPADYGRLLADLVAALRSSPGTPAGPEIVATVPAGPPSGGGPAPSPGSPGGPVGPAPAKPAAGSAAGGAGGLMLVLLVGLVILAFAAPRGGVRP